MRKIKMFENYMSREEMCNYLNSCGYKMSNLEVCSTQELQAMCDRMMSDNPVTENHMSREEMCNYLNSCGYTMSNLEVCSTQELRSMCDRMMSKEPHRNNKGITEHRETQNYMFFSNLETIKRLVDDMLEMDESTLDNVLTEHDWASDHISVAAENVEHVFNFVIGHKEPHHDHKKMMMNHEMSYDKKELMKDEEVMSDDNEMNQEMPEEIQKENLRRFKNFR